MIKFKRSQTRFMINRVSDKDTTTYTKCDLKISPFHIGQAKKRVICDKSNSRSQTLICGRLWLNITFMFCTAEPRLVRSGISHAPKCGQVTRVIRELNWISHAQRHGIYDRFAKM